MMTPIELKTFLKAVATGDRRTTDEDDVRYWAAIAQQGRWTLATAMRALIMFREQHPGQWLDPGHITEIIRDARRRAAETFVVPQEPDNLKICDLPQWHREQLAAHQDRLLAAWAAGKPLPVTVEGAAEIAGQDRRRLTAGLNTTTCPEELKDQVHRDFERAVQNRTDHRRLPTRLRRFVGDPDQRAKAIAELEAKRAEREAEAS